MINTTNIVKTLAAIIPNISSKGSGSVGGNLIIQKVILSRPVRGSLVTFGSRPEGY